MVGDEGAQPHLWWARLWRGIAGWYGGCAARGTRLGGGRTEGSAMAQGPWFRPKRSGLGWTPITWQGWLVTILSCLVVVGLNLMLVLRLGSR
jgi:hypothetical protein